MNKLEKLILIIFISLCVLTPFLLTIKNPLEIITHILPLWIWDLPAGAYWIYSGKPFWQTLLATISVTSLGLILAYFVGAGLIELLFRFIAEKLKIKEGLSQKFSAFFQKHKFLNWLNKQSVWIILIFFALPLPIIGGTIPVIIMRLKRVKYGLWYLLAVNSLVIYLILLGIYSQININ